MFVWTCGGHVPHSHIPPSACLNLDATIPLRAVRPSVIDVVVLVEAVDNEGFDVTDQIEASQSPKRKAGQTRCYSFQCLGGRVVSELID